MKKKLFVFYGLNLFVTVVIAMLFGGVLGSIDGNKTVLGLLITFGVQLSPFITTIIYRIKYKEKAKYTYEINRYSIVASALPILLIVTSAFVLSLLGISYVKTEYKGIVLIVAILTTIAGAYTEEFGWRGCLLPIAETEYSPFASSIFVGLLWGIWHFFKIASIGIVGFLLFMPTILMFSIIMTFIYHKSNNSLLNMVIFHASINLTNIFMIYNRESKAFYLVLLGVEIIVLFLFHLKDRSYFKIKHEQA